MDFVDHSANFGKINHDTSVKRSKTELYSCYLVATLSNQKKMNQYLVTAYDYSNDGALQHRMSVRPHHLDGVKELKANGNYVIGGAILNDEGNMIGSVMIVQFETDEELQAWQLREPYISQKVWETVDIKPFRVAAV